jgi:hypothetical protein
MLMNLLLGLGTMVVCLFLQSFLLLAALRYYRKRLAAINNASIWASVAVVKGVMLLLVLGNLGQIAIWAWLFLLLGEFPRFDASFYHSAVNFATLGYGDLVMSEKHKLLGPLEAVNGVLMIGVSTAALMSTFQDAMVKTIQARKTVN